MSSSAPRLLVLPVSKPAVSPLIVVELAVGVVALICVATGLFGRSVEIAIYKVAFETANTAGTSDLPMGISVQLTCFGKGVIIATIVLGHVGQLLVLGRMWIDVIAGRSGARSAVRIRLG